MSYCCIFMTSQSLGEHFYKLRQMEGHQQFSYASPGLTKTKKPFFVNVIKINE
jgi:hypothetical protein